MGGIFSFHFDPFSGHELLEELSEGNPNLLIHISNERL